MFLFLLQENVVEMGDLGWHRQDKVLSSCPLLELVIPEVPDNLVTQPQDSESPNVPTSVSILDGPD